MEKIAGNEAYIDKEKNIVTFFIVPFKIEKNKVVYGEHERHDYNCNNYDECFDLCCDLCVEYIEVYSKKLTEFYRYDSGCGVFKKTGEF